MLTRSNYFTILYSDLPVLVDCDGVLSACEQAFDAVAVKYFDRHIDITQNKFFDQIDGLAEKIDYAIMYSGLVENMRPIPKGIEFLRKLERTFGEDRVYVCTHPRNEHWLNQRAAWLIKQGIPMRRQIQIENKTLVPGYLIDDREKNLVTRESRQGFLLEQPWNRQMEDHERGDYMDAFAWLKANVAV